MILTLIIQNKIDILKTSLYVYNIFIKMFIIRRTLGTFFYRYKVQMYLKRPIIYSKTDVNDDEMYRYYLL